MIDVEKLTIRSTHEHLRRGDFSVRELVQSCLQRIERFNGKINAYLEVFEDVLTQADEAQARFERKNADLLTGVPIAVKDNILIRGRRATAASRILDGFTAPYDAGAIVKLKAAGAIFLGRTNMDEFAMGGSTEHSAFGVTRNPYDHSRVAGGSSGGSAAAVAMGGALAALGSDTGGSVRQPAAFCGLVGLKPTYGSVSRFGLIAMGSSLDQIGPIGRTVEDVEIIFEQIKGRDPNDSTSEDFPERHASHQRKITIGVPRDLSEGDGLEVEVKQAFEASLKKFRELGFSLAEIELPLLRYALPVYYIVMSAEASTNLARYDGVRYGFFEKGVNLKDDYSTTRASGFGEEVRRRIILGTFVLSAGYYEAYYGKAQGVRARLRSDFEKVFRVADVVATPTAPSGAFRIGEKITNPLEMYLTDIFTVTANIVGIPALSVPMGFAERTGSRLPLGLQIMGGIGQEKTLFAVAKKFCGEE